MKLTRRGIATLVIVLIAVASGIAYGPRGLNAIAAPGAVALLAAAVQVSRIQRPPVTRNLPARGYRGETVRVRLNVDGDRPLRATLEDRLGDAFDPAVIGLDRTLAGRPIAYDVELTARGRCKVGPLSIEVSDVLGLVTDRFHYEDRDEMLVWPRVHHLVGTRHESLVQLYGGAGDDRRGFDHLREYERGDPLRDIHWPTSAKQPTDDLVVKQYASEEGARIVQIVAMAESGYGDAMAEATASLALHLLRAGVQVGVTTPSGRVDAGSGDGQRARILDHLATAASGSLQETGGASADIVIRAGEDGTRVEVTGRQLAFAELIGHDPGRAASAAHGVAG